MMINLINMMMKPLLDRLKQGEVILLDGGTGSSLQQRGLAVGRNAEHWVLEKPEEIRNLHQQFIAAGSALVLTCTFGGSRLRLAAVGLEDQFEHINTRAVALARQAIAGQPVYLAGSIGPTGCLLNPDDRAGATNAEASFAEQAAVLLRAGVDLLVVETQYQLPEALAAVRGVRSVSSLPLVCSFSVDANTSVMGVPLAEAVAALARLDVDVFGINCGISPQDNLRALAALHQLTSLPIWFKPNAGTPLTDENGKPVYALAPKAMGALLPAWLAAGAQLIGGCCGTSPAHLHEISCALRQQSEQGWVAVS